jgi:transaldolase / glucose-6-phosphate isomerase
MGTIRMEAAGHSKSLATQLLVPGRLEQAYRRELGRLFRSNALERLWARDTSLWPSARRNQQDLAANLAWLDLPGQLGKYMAHAGEFVAQTQAAGFQDVVFIAIGDSNLAMEAVSRASDEIRWRRIFLLDTTDPGGIRSLDEQLDLRRTIFVFANKSGKRIETHALLLYFLERLKAEGLADPGRCFVAVTEENSYLASHALTYGFLKTFLDPPGIKGRFSSLIHFGLLQSALWRFDPEDLTARALAMRDLCREAGESNPAAGLAAFLAAVVLEEHDKLLFLSTPSLEASTLRVGQLVGTSMSRQNRGIIPITGPAPNSLEAYREGAAGVTLTMEGEDDSVVRTAEERWRSEGVPFVSISLKTAAELGAGVFKWEMATALACALLNVNPFDEPDTQVGKERSAEMVESLAARGELPGRRPRVREKGIELYAEGETRQQISTLNMAEALRTFLELRQPDGYVAIISFVGGHTEAAQAELLRIRDLLARKLEMPVLLSKGPRYLHYFEQVYKGGPSDGLFVVLTGESVEDLPIPGAGYTFGQLHMALALGDFEALQSRQKLAIRLHLTGVLENDLADVEQFFQQSLSNTRVIKR